MLRPVLRGEGGAGPSGVSWEVVEDPTECGFLRTGEDEVGRAPDRTYYRPSCSV